MLSYQDVSAASGSWTGGTINTGYSLKVVWSESSQNPKTNTSIVTAKAYLVQKAGYSLYVSAAKPLTIKIGSASKSSSYTAGIQNSGGVTTYLGSFSTTVTHTSNGSLSVPISVSFGINATLSGTFYSTMSTSSTAVLDTLDRTAPTITTTVTGVTSNSITVKGTANTTCDSWYYSKDNGSTWTAFGSSGTTNTKTITGLTPNTSYKIKIKARKTSNYVVGTSSAVTKLTPPETSTGLYVDESTQTSGTLNWSPVTGATSYKIYKNGTLVTSGITDTNYRFSGLTPDTTYTLGVSSVNASGSSSITEVQYVTPEAVLIPQNPIITNQSHSSVTLVWDAQSGVVDYYKIYRNGTYIGNSDTEEYEDVLYDNLASAYKITAVDLDGVETNFSEEIFTYDITAPVIDSIDSDSQILATDVFLTYSDDNSGVNPDAFKWAYGEWDLDYFNENGNSFDGSKFRATRSGLYSVYVEDMDGNASVYIIQVDDLGLTYVSGGYKYSQTDLSVDDIGNTISFDRNYDSTNTSSGPFGTGWSFSFFGKIETLTSPENVTMVTLPGGDKEFFNVADGIYTGIDTRDTLTYDGLEYTLDTGYNIYKFNDGGYLTEISDLNENTVTITVDTNGYPTQITDSVERTYNIGYTNGNITSITDPAGRSVTYTYNGNKLDSIYSTSGVLINQYVYNSEGLLESVKDSYGNIIDSVTYDSSCRIVDVINNDETTTYSYYLDSYGNQVISDGESLIIYDNYGNIVTDESGTTTKYAAFNGDILEEIDSSGNITTYEYDQYGNITSVETKDIEGNVTGLETYDLTYFSDSSDINQRVYTKETREYAEDGASYTSEFSYITTVYDINGNVVSENNVKGEIDEIVNYTYYGNGLLKTQTDNDGTVTTYTYDSNGYVSHISIENLKGDVTETDYTHNIIGFEL